jgi:poly(hydroxyalkanoate) depolymerase family esterase
MAQSGGFLMNDQMNEIERFSPFGGQLIEELVKGSDNQLITAENTVITETGKDRTMFSYIPTSGCPDAKQCQVLMVLRDSGDQHGAEQLMKRLQLDKLAEDKHFILLFPNPETDGWNYQLDPQREDDVSFLVRCFTCLPKSKGTVAGFNGMIFYLGCSETSSAMLASLAAVSPINCAALMVEKFPSDYQLPVGDLEQVQDAWIYGDNRSYLDHLKKVNGIQFGKAIDDTEYFENSNNPNIRFFASKHELSVSEVWKAWDYLFSETRRWRNDSYGTYQKRTNFTERGFTAHVKDSSLGVNNGYEHTWYEYIPEQLRGTSQKVPLLFYFHGGNCIPLYGAEQSGYHDLADQEDFIVVYPRASTNKRWNCWDDSDAGVSDFQFILALIKHMKEIHPIDETRIYVSGFSMGSMMTNALCCAYPDVFAAGAALNAQNFGYFGNLTSTMCLTTKRIDTDETIMNKGSSSISVGI